MSNQIFQIGEREYPIEDCYILGWFEDGVDEEIQWSIVVELTGDEVYASFQGITIQGVKNFHDLQEQSFFPDEDDENELFIYEGIDEELVYVDEIHFGKLVEDEQAIEVEIQGFVADEMIDDDTDEDEELEGTDFVLTLQPQLEAIYFVTKNKKNAEKFVKEFMKIPLERVDIEYEEEEDGVWNCIINYA